MAYVHKPSSASGGRRLFAEGTGRTRAWLKTNVTVVPTEVIALQEARIESDVFSPEDRVLANRFRDRLA